MGRLILVTGGAKSGKSAWAEYRAAQLAPSATYIATAQAFDVEMEKRIAEHLTRRGPEWTTVEEPRDLPRVLDETDGGQPRMIDCLTLWLSNEMLAADGDWRDALDALVSALSRQTAPVILVTNEVGSGIVPDNALGRRFQDAAGVVNQTIGAIADEVVLVVAGQALTIKGSAT
ncbi:MAG: bifunctional adenosylcobinamide kinase/adenosylcobinamide-phosphate guanylyltransferase [Boseongicola sp.]|nr:bifunctional adenosylcobinamide kinase/adenosylcobinamide-phosphate guanylyltransferase [Boseongicola sp.]NNL17910.1 bifunctional adenosylcobinamide kinase/adenosylcobinamide-phosphate guanylyltransferase [Boseongicola sp.]